MEDGDQPIVCAHMTRVHTMIWKQVCDDTSDIQYVHYVIYVYSSVSFHKV